ncbi:MAG: nucleotidyl transferase AbiEii/AbiGii toxin family protein [Bacteroidota bacterium]
MSDQYYTNKLYPLQNKVLKVLNQASTKLYLTGGTVVSRIYYHHRYSDDLDLFLNWDKDFVKESGKAIAAIKEKFRLVRDDISQDSFARVFVHEKSSVLKVEFVNDVEFHSGGFQSSSLYHKIDTPKNILSNKVCALSRSAAKDLADLIWISRNEKFNWNKIFEDAKKKDSWVNEVDVLLAIKKFPIEKLLSDVKWIRKTSAKRLQSDIKVILKDMASAANNSLCKK